MCSLSSTVGSSASWIARRLSKGCGSPVARFTGDLLVVLFQKGILTTRLTGSYVIASTSNHRSCIRSIARTSFSGSLIVIVTSPRHRATDLLPSVPSCQGRHALHRLVVERDDYAKQPHELDYVQLCDAEHAEAIQPLHRHSSLKRGPVRAVRSRR